MEVASLCNRITIGGAPLLVFSSINNSNGSLICASKFYPSISRSFKAECCYDNGMSVDSDDDPVTASTAYAILGTEPHCSPAQLKAAFRIKVKQFHPDVMSDGRNSDTMIRRVIQAYEILSNYSRSEIIERECMDPFDQPESEAIDLFVNEVLCIGKGCPYSCVNSAPHAFKFSSLSGSASAASQGEVPGIDIQHVHNGRVVHLGTPAAFAYCHGEDYRVRVAVGQCPRSCIHYVTPSQRIILEELLSGIIGMPYDTSAEADLMYSLIVKAKYENNRYTSPKKKNTNVSSKHVDWF